jgi:hypothetical protein
VAQLRSMLDEAKPRPGREIEHALTQSIQSSPFSARWLAIAAALAVAFGGAYGGIEFMRWESSVRSKDAAREADTRKETAAAIAQRLAELDAERERRNAAQRQRENEADLRRKEAASSEAAEIERRRKEEMERIEAGENAKQQSGAQCERGLRFHLRGLQAIEVGDIYSARQFFKLGADEGLPQSAAALGGTYDPAELAKLNVVGLEPDAKTAQAWYEKARVLRAIGPLRGCEKVVLPSPDADLTEFRAAYTSGDGLAYMVIKDEKGERIFRYGDESRLAAKLGTRGYTLFTCNEPWTLSPQKEEDAAILLKATVVKARRSSVHRS